MGTATNPALKQEDMPNQLLDLDLRVDIRTEPALQFHDQVLTIKPVNALQHVQSM